ncbi:hypothetical protein OB919_01475 [Halobacteria archaeon AArc-curdl1]|uniref:Uncharacterized protein n=1 Tax=Natronosalvus hydrolyticus TaxID=2979988 RepID=A0AAP2Z5U3_9EURY|nr:hypothetical protein [Halobacteria archaeon AArc-curdl1]
MNRRVGESDLDVVRFEPRHVRREFERVAAIGQVESPVEDGQN